MKKLIQIEGLWMLIKWFAGAQDSDSDHHHFALGSNQLNLNALQTYS
jgi:hypothetical protein